MGVILEDASGADLTLNWWTWRPKVELLRAEGLVDDQEAEMLQINGVGAGLDGDTRSTADNRSEHHSPPELGRFQPDPTNWVRTVDGDRPRRRLIDRCDSPASHRSHNSSPQK